jgi:hypothetical protein
LGAAFHANHLLSLGLKSVGALEVALCLSKYRSHSSFTRTAGQLHADGV